MLVMVKALVPFVSVKVADPEEPTVTEPRFWLAGARFAVEPLVPVPVNVAV